MKKLKHLFYLFIFLCSCNNSKSQINSGLFLGYDTHGRMISTWSIGYEKSIFNFQGEIRPSLSRNVAAHNYIGFRFSLNLENPDGEEMTGLSVLPGIFYGYDLKSQDKVYLNKWFFAPTLKTIIMITDNGGLSFDGMYINKSVQISMGIHLRFTNRDHL